jgi:hypothetical protein
MKYKRTKDTNFLVISPFYMGPCYNDMARHRVADGGDGLQMRRVAANIFNKQLRTVQRMVLHLGGWVEG